MESAEPDVAFGKGLRAAAGHINNDLHKVTIHFTTTEKGTDTPVAATLYLTFEGNKGSEDDKRAKFMVGPPEDRHQVEETTITTDAITGKDSVTVLSSDVITTDIKVKAEWKDLNDKYHDKGDVALDFVQAVSLRRFGIIVVPDKPGKPGYREGAEDDNGWTADPIFLTTPYQPCTMTVYLKFPKKAGQENDTPYFDSSGNVIKPLPDHDDWPAVAGHQLHVSIVGIAKRASKSSDFASLDDSPLYVYFVNSSWQLIDKDGNVLNDANGNPATKPSQVANYKPPKFITVTTGEKGTAKVYVMSGPLINNVVYFGLEAEDQSQIKQ